MIRCCVILGLEAMLGVPYSDHNGYIEQGMCHVGGVFKPMPGDVVDIVD